jgi:hypothetical protein
MLREGFGAIDIAGTAGNDLLLIGNATERRSAIVNLATLPPAPARRLPSVSAKLGWAWKASGQRDRIRLKVPAPSSSNRLNLDVGVRAGKNAPFVFKNSTISTGDA